MSIIADTNIFLAVVLSEPEKEQTSNCKLLSSEILPYEITSPFDVPGKTVIPSRKATKKYIGAK